MTRGLSIGAVVLSLCGWACEAGAQDVVWRPTGRPAELLPPARLQEAPDVGATLGRPVPLFTPRVDPGVVTASYHDMTAPTPVRRNSPDAADGADSEPGGLFAVDRPTVRRAVYSGEPINVAPRPGPAATDIGPAPTANPFPSPQVTEMDAPVEDGAAGLFPEAEAGGSLFYARAEYLLWSFKKDTVPPLVTTSAPQDFGFLGRPTTQVLFGGDSLDSGTHSGGRFTVGFWLDDCNDKAIELSGFFLPGSDQNFQATSAMFPVLGRPFFSINRNTEFAQLTAFPGESVGNVAVQNSSNLYGLEADLRCKLCCGCTCCDCCPCASGLSYRVDGLAGFRYLNLRENLTITENLINLPTAPPGRQNLAATVFDSFSTRNQFYGGQVGLDGVIDRGPWSLDVLGKLALGDTSQRLDINGGQTVTSLATGVTTPFRGGLLALPSNIGTHNQNRFSVVPEIDLTASYHFSEHVRIFAGYDFLYWTNVIRPGQQIDRTLDETQIPNFDTPGTIAPAGQNRPAVLFHQSDFWAQGLNLGLEFRY